MNPEQIKRLVEMTNTSKFLDKFKDTSGEDRFVDFDVLDPEDIIKKFLGDSPEISSKSKGLSITVEKGPDGTHVTKKETNDPGLDTEDSQFFSDVEDTKEKSARFYKIAKDVTFTGKYDDNPALIGDQDTLPDFIQEGIVTSNLPEKKKKKKKIAPHDEKMMEEKLLTKKESANYECDFLAENISSKFKGIYSSKKHAGFEIEALANFGLDSLPVLQAVRSKLGMELLSGGSITERQVKEASQYYLSDKTSLGMSEVKKYIEKTSEYINACLDLRAFYSYTEKTAMAFMPLAAFGLGMGGSGLAGEAAGTLGHRFDRAVNHWADRIRARDETLKDTRKKVVDYALTGLANSADRMFDAKRDASKEDKLKPLRLHAAKLMLSKNPDLRSAGKENIAYVVDMIGTLAPQLSTKVPFLTAHAKQMIYNSDGGISSLDAQSAKSLSEAERAFENLGQFKPA
jgi:hypothetical protein